MLEKSKFATSLRMKKPNDNKNNFLQYTDGNASFPGFWGFQNNRPG